MGRWTAEATQMSRIKNFLSGTCYLKLILELLHYCYLPNSRVASLCEECSLYLVNRKFILVSI